MRSTIVQGILDGATRGDEDIGMPETVIEDIVIGLLLIYQGSFTLFDVFNYKTPALDRGICPSSVKDIVVVQTPTPPRKELNELDI